MARPRLPRSPACQTQRSRAAASQAPAAPARLPQQFRGAASVDNERVLLVAAISRGEERKADEKVTAFSSEGSFFP